MKAPGPPYRVPAADDAAVHVVRAPPTLEQELLPIALVLWASSVVRLAEAFQGRERLDAGVALAFAISALVPLRLSSTVHGASRARQRGEELS